MSIRTFIGEQWHRMVFSVLAAGITTAAIALEFQHSYVERAIGRYLTWHNDGRQEAGQIWESVSLSEEVQRQLDDLVADRRAEVSLDEQVNNLVQLIEMASQRDQVLLTRERFLEIYNRMPVYQSALIMDPVRLLELIGTLDSWQRTLVEFIGGELVFYLVDESNYVLVEQRLAADFVTFYMSGQATGPFNQSTDGLPAAEPYPASIFYDAWAALPEQHRDGIPLGSDELIAWRYRLQQVAIDLGNLVGDRMVIAFELSSDQGLTTVRILGRSLAVLHLANEMNRLTGRPPITDEETDSGFFPGSFQEQ